MVLGGSAVAQMRYLVSGDGGRSDTGLSGEIENAPYSAVCSRASQGLADGNAVHTVTHRIRLRDSAGKTINGDEDRVAVFGEFGQDLANGRT